MYITSEFAIKPLIYMFKLMFIGTYKYFKIGLKFFCQMPISSYKQNKGGFMKIKVTFITKTGHEVVEEMDSDNGSTCDYKLRAMALGWTVKEVINIG